MNRTKIALLSLLAAVVTVCSVMFFVACGEKEPEVETVALEWVLAEGVSVKVDGAAEQPATWNKGENLVFIVTVPEGYDPIVKTTSTVTPKEGKYTISKVSRDTKITVTLDEKVTAVKVAKVEGAEFVYFAGDALNTSTITVTATYAVTGDKTVESGYTVNPTLFVIGDTSFTVTFKGITSESVELDKAVEGKEFGFSAVTLEVGKDDEGNDVPYYVLKGTYSNYDVEKFGEVGFDFQEQGFYSEAQGGSAGWTYVLYQTEMTEFADGLFTLKVDMTKLAENLGSKGITSMLFNPHMGFNTPGDNANPNVEVENYTEGESITVGGIEYKLHREKSEENQPITTWGMVGVIVSDPTAPSLKNVSLENKDGKPCLVINGIMAAEDEAAAITRLQSQFNYFDICNQSVEPGYGAGTPEWTEDVYALSYEDGTISVTYDLENNSFKIYLDLSVAMTDDLLIISHTLPGNNGGNLSLSAVEDAQPITVGGFTFTLIDSTGFTTSWLQGVTCIQVKAAD